MHFLLVELFFIPFCLGRIVGHASSHQTDEKSFSLSKDALPRRALLPALSIRTGPRKMAEMMTGETQFLECEAGGTPTPTIYWLKDGKKIQGLSDTNEVVSSQLGLGFTHSRLYFDCASEADAGEYTCVAENEFMRESQMSLVLVSGGNKNAACLTKSYVPAHIYMWTHTRLEVMGTDVQFFCRSAGEPQPQVLWQDPDGNTLLDSHKYKITENGDLIIRNIQWSDMGGYTCRVKNFEGSDEALVFLYPTMPDHGKSERA